MTAGQTSAQAISADLFSYVPPTHTHTHTHRADLLVKSEEGKKGGKKKSNPDTER